MFQLYDEKLRISYSLTGLIKEIGRGEECDISLFSDSSVSRVHARLDRDGEDWVLVDLGSTNGTFVNGDRIAEARLRPGDQIEIGDSVLRFLPLQVADRPLQKKTTNVNIRKADITGEQPAISKGVFSRVKTVLKKK